MSTIDFVQRRSVRVLGAGLAVGALSALANSFYFAAFQAVIGRHYAQTGYASILASSVFPPLLGSLAALAVSKYTPHAGTIFAVVTWGITGLSLLTVFSPQLANGTPKPEAFDALVLPMHVVVGAAAAWAIPRALRTPG